MFFKWTKFPLCVSKSTGSVQGGNAPTASTSPETMGILKINGNIYFFTFAGFREGKCTTCRDLPRRCGHYPGSLL